MRKDILMAKNIGGKIVLEGAKEYTTNLKTISLCLIDLRKEMMLNTEQFASSRNSVEALSSKYEILKKQCETAAEKVKIYSKYLNEVKEAEALAREDLTKYSEELKTAEDKLKELTLTGKGSNEQIKAQNEYIESLRGKVAGAEAQITSFTQKEYALSAQLNNAKAEELRYGEQLRVTSGYLEEAKASTDGCAKSIDQFGNTVKKADQETKNISDTLDSLRNNLAIEKLSETSKKLLENFKECAEAAEKFQYSIAKVQSIAQVSESDLSLMSDGIRDVATSMGFSASEIAEATYQAISASVDASEAVDFVANASKLARAGFTDVTTSVDILTTALNAYGKEANTTEHIMDALVNTQNLGKTTVAELAQNMGTVIPTAAAYNVSLDQLSSAYVILTRNGVNTANATTYISGMLTELADNGSNVAKILQEKTGKSFGQLTKDGWTLGDVMSLLQQEVNGDSEAFANLWGNVRAGRGALNIANAGAEEYNKVLESMATNVGAVDKAFEIMSDTAEMTNAQLEASVDNFKIAIGESLAPTLDWLKEAGIEILNVVTDFIRENPALVSAITGFSATILAITGALAAYNVAMALANALSGNFVGIAIALAAAGTVATIMGVANSSRLAADEIGNFGTQYKQTADELVTKNKDLVGSTNDLYDSIKNEAGYTDTLIKELKELNSQSGDNEARHRRMQQIVNELNSRYEGINLTIDEQTGKLSENCQGWEDQIAAMQHANAVAAMQEKLGDLNKALADNSYELYVAETAYRDAQDEFKALGEQMAAMAEEEPRLVDGIFGDTLLATDEEIEAFQSLLSEYDALAAKREEIKNSLPDLSTAYSELNDSQTELQDSISGVTEYMESQLGVVNDLSDATDDAASSTTNLREISEEEWEKIYEATDSAVRGQVSLFEEMNTKSDLTLSQMTERFRSQADAYSAYAENVKAALEYMETSGSPAANALLQSVMDMGVEGAGYLDELVKAAQADSEEWNKAVEEFANSAINSEAASQQWEAYAVEYGVGTDRIKELMDQYNIDMTSLSEEQRDALLALATETKEGMVDTSGAMVDDSATAVITELPQLTSATETMAQSVIDTANTTLGITEAGGRSEVFYQMGQTIDESLADGITDGTSKVTDAIHSVVDSAVSAAKASLADIASQLDTAIGEAIGG